MPDARPAPSTAADLPATCRVRGWKVFGPGYHKGTLYTPADCERLAANFRRLRDHLTPVAKIGHDAHQRMRKSLGFLSLGEVVGVTAAADGAVSLDIDGIPTAVGREGAAGRLNSGSVELLPRIADPDDPAEEVPGPILTGVAFLGEEQPAVKGFPPPAFEFEDGTPVPPSADPAPWLLAQAEVSRAALAAAADAPPTVTLCGRAYAATVICFSEMSPMNPDELKAKLEAAGLPPEMVAKCIDACAAKGGTMGDMVVKHEDDDAPKPPPAAGAMSEGVPDKATAPLDQFLKYADDPDATPEQKAFAAVCKKFTADADAMKKEFGALTKRFGALEAAASEDQKKKDEAQMAAFSAEVDRACAGLRKKVSPDQLAKVVKPHALGILTAKSYAAEADRVKAFSDFFAGYAALPDNPLLADTIDDGKARAFEATAESRQLLKHLAVTNPRVVDRLTAKN